MAILKLSLLCLISLTCTACYRMPNEDEYSVVPTTNNPSVTREKQTNPLPGIGY